MTPLIVGKLNYGEQRAFARAVTLERTILRAGAHEALVAEKEVRVKWKAGTDAAVYAIDGSGRVDPQLAWDIEPTKGTS